MDLPSFNSSIISKGLVKCKLEHQKFVASTTDARPSRPVYIICIVSLEVYVPKNVCKFGFSVGHISHREQV